MATYHFKYGKTKFALNIDSDRVAGELKIAEKPVLSDPETAIRESLRHPIGSAPLAKVVNPGETVTILVNDSTRVANSQYTKNRPGMT